MTNLVFSWVDLRVSVGLYVVNFPVCKSFRTTGFHSLRWLFVVHFYISVSSDKPAGQLLFSSIDVPDVFELSALLPDSPSS